jgi:hypothetical protein
MVIPVTHDDDLATWRFGRVRRVYWALLAGTLLAALAIPSLYVWRAASSSLAAHACIWPAAPRADEPAHLVVSLPDPIDRAAVQGPWAQVVAKWDMVTMGMGTHQSAVPGQSGRGGTFTIPLPLDMPGPWWVQVVLHTPGRPEWHTRLQVAVQPSGAQAATSQPANGVGSRDGCLTSGGSAST